MPELDRRDFLKIVGLSAGAAATVACKEPVEKIIPYLNQPEEIVPGIATYYASTCRECPMSCGTIVKTREGRPIKVEGNPADPISQGKLCLRGQASLYRTYDATRFRSPLVRDADLLIATAWEKGMETLVAKLKEHAGRVAFIGGLETGTLDSLIDSFVTAIGAQRVRFEPFAHEALRQANKVVFGEDAVPSFELEKSDFVIAFGSDWEETWLSPVHNQIGYAKSRRMGQGYSVYVGPRLSVSGAEMDEWLAPNPGSEIQLALALAAEVAKAKGTDMGGAAGPLRRFSARGAAAETGIPADRIVAVAARMAAAEAPVALPPGNELQGSNAAQFAAAVMLLNAASGALGNTVVFGPDHNVTRLSRFSDVKELAGKMRGGEITMLLVHGSNPVYAAPPLGFADAMKDVYTVSFSSANDETTALADLVLPDHTPYESWGDAEPVAGVRLVQQPTVQPLMDTRAVGDVLLDAGRALGHGEALPQGSFRDVVAASWSSTGFDQALATGGSFRRASARTIGIADTAGSLSFESARLAGEGDLALVVYPSLSFYDGRSARIAMLQEVSNPVTKLVWGSYAEIHPDTAASLGVEAGDVVRVSTDAGSIELPVFPHETLRPDVIAIEAGQGHQPVDPHAPDPDSLQRRNQIGVNALALLGGAVDSTSGGLAWYSAKAVVEKTGETRLMPLTQPTFDQEGRGIAQVVPLATHARGGNEHHDEHADDGGHGDSYAPVDPAAVPYADAMHLETKPFDPADDGRDPDYRWGLTLDLDACTGCNACITACVQENNIPTIGETIVRQGREMHWIRMERYVEHAGDAVQVYHVPMMCQHCGSAPCETVCPVFATYHNDQGLNVMVYNRCIGTRYCSNNCPYKVRRFNYFPYDTLIRDPEQLALNPDVTVRSKGVMEKCSMCVQRINGARDTAIVEGRTIREGEFTTACAQTCPSNAITFGNYKDPESQVTKNNRDPRAYWVFHHLNTRPGVTYLKSIDRSEKV
jgi:molybdopterin-containing oxidoreductase family iron-sulfur binding subunit